MENNASMYAAVAGNPVGVHNATEGNIFTNVYQWQAPEPAILENTTFTTCRTKEKEPHPLEKKINILQNNLLQLLGQFEEKGIPVNELWKTFKVIYKFQPRADNYSVSDMNDILPLFSKSIGIDHTPLGPRFVLTKHGKLTYRRMFHPEDIIDEQNFTSFDISATGTTPHSEPRQYQNHAPRQMSYSQAATTNLPQNTGRHQQNGYCPPPSCQQVLSSNTYHTNVQPLTKETLAYAAGMGKPRQKGPTVREILAEPDWSRRTSSEWDEGQFDLGYQDVIQEFDTGLSEVETTIQRNIIKILARVHPTGVPARSIWGVYKKIYKSVPTKDDVLNNKLKSINHIFERFTQTIARKSIEKTISFVLTDRGVEYAVKLDLLPKCSKDKNDAVKSETSMTRQRLQGSGTGL